MNWRFWLRRPALMYAHESNNAFHISIPPHLWDLASWKSYLRL